MGDKLGSVELPASILVTHFGPAIASSKRTAPPFFFTACAIIAEKRASELKIELRQQKRAMKRWTETSDLAAVEKANASACDEFDKLIDELVRRVPQNLDEAVAIASYLLPLVKAPFPC